jgi:hypothetical protein
MKHNNCHQEKVGSFQPSFFKEEMYTIPTINLKEEIKATNVRQNKHYIFKTWIILE